MSSVEPGTPKRRASSNASQKQQSTLLQAFSNSKKKPRTSTSPMLIDLTKTPTMPAGRPFGGQRNTVRKLVIKNLATKDTSDRETQYYENTFRILGEAIDLILASRDVRGLQDLYKGCENIVRGGKAERCASLALEKMRTRIKDVQGTLRKTIALDGRPVSVMVETWATWNRQISLLRSILFYLDRTFLLNSPSQLPLTETGTQMFRNELMLDEHIKNSFFDDLIKLYNEARDTGNSQAQQDSLLKEAITLVNSTRVYASIFESYITQSTEQYFRNESASLTGRSASDIINHISSRLASESDRADHLLRPSTKLDIMRIVREQLIKNNAHQIVHGFEKLVRDLNHAQLKQMYEFLGMVEEIDSLRQAFSSYIKKAGTEILSDKANDKTMVESLLSFKEDMDKILLNSFSSEDLFSKALRDQFASFINSRGDVPAEMMAKFIDSVLRSGNRKFDETDLERQMARLMDIFRFIASKDVFEAFYKKDLAKRLLLNKSASADAERSLLAKLKVECGPVFTQKLEGMFKDIDISRDYAKSFMNKKLEVFVLSQGSWPTYPEVKLQIPDEMSRALQEYQDFYLKSNNGRKLMWRHSLGHCQIKAQFPKGDKELMVSLFQGVVILLFQRPDQVLNYADIRESTGLDDNELKRTLQSLACGKPETRILLKSPKGKDVNETDNFKVNEGFQNPKKIVKINQIQMKETAEENQATHERVILDRSFEIQAAIIRIMKSAKKKSHSELVAATIDTIKGRGLPQVIDIKKAIEKLLDREYLSRHDKEYHYEA